jgi:hypothetical protein
MKKQTKKPEFVPLRYFVGDDRNYDMLNEECVHMQTRYSQLVIKNGHESLVTIPDFAAENMRNGMTEAEAYHAAELKSLEPLEKPLKALHDLMALRDAIKHEKKILQDRGIKFVDGRKDNTGSVIRKRIAKILEKKPAMKNPELWAAVAANPPRGWTAYDNRVGKYLEGEKNKNMTYGRFCNVCGEERKKIKR